MKDDSNTALLKIRYMLMRMFITDFMKQLISFSWHSDSKDYVLMQNEATLMSVEKSPDFFSPASAIITELFKYPAEYGHFCK